MANLKIHFWDNPSSHAERNPFREKLKTAGIKTTVDISDLVNIDLLFIHGADSPSLNSYIFSNLVFKVSFGDNVTTMHSIFTDENRISYINAKELSERFDTIVKELEEVANLTIEELYEIIFAIDPDLERLLQPFATANPLDENNELKDAKTKLQTYVDKLLTK